MATELNVVTAAAVITAIRTIVATSAAKVRTVADVGKVAPGEKQPTSHLINILQVSSAVRIGSQCFSAALISAT